MTRNRIVASLVVLVLAAGAAWAEDKALAPKEIGQAFAAAVKAGGFPEAARDKVLEIWAAQLKAKDIEPEFLDGALKILNVDYSRAVLRIDAERLEEAEAILTKLAEKPESKYLEAGIALQTARIKVKQRNWEAAVEQLEKIRGGGALANYVLCKQKIDLMTARACARIGRLDEAIDIAKKWAETDDGRQVLLRLEVEKDSADKAPIAVLDDTADHMDDVKKKLDTAETGRPTRDKQEKIVAMLDLLIEKAEDAENQSGQGQGQGQGQGEGQGQGQGQGQGKGGSGPPSGTGVPSSPATYSALPGGASSTDGRAASTGTLGDAWGRLSPKEQEKVLDAFRKQLPRQYHELVEAYYKSLAEGEKK